MATADEIRRAADVLQGGGLVAMPTETVYGLAANACNQDAVRRIFELKGRPTAHPLIVHLPAPRLASEPAWIELLQHWARDVPQLAIDLALAFWPGPLTLILRRSSTVPDEVTGGLDTVGLRVPGHPVAQALLGEIAATQPHGRAGLAAPSANRFGHISPTTAQHVKDEFGDKLLLASALPPSGEALPAGVAGVILDGGSTEIGIESTIVDLSRGSPRILRPGAIGLEQLLQVAGTWHGEETSLQDAARVRAPGMLPQHYAPRAELRLLEARGLAALLEVQHTAHAKLPSVAIIAPRLLLLDLPLPKHVAIFPLGDGLAGQAHDLYAALRAADERADVIYAVLPPPTGLGIAIRDRLSRAAGLGADETVPDEA